MKTVLILKSESDSSEEYARQLQENNFNAIFVPTLGFGFKQIDLLREKLLTPEKYLGIIFTSPRSVEAVEEALQKDPIPEAWKLLHNYSVGVVTHNLVKQNLNELKTEGKETGNGGNLGDYIKETFEGDKSKPFLFPCGNLRTDTMLVKLIEAGFLFDPIEVYETISHPDLGENLTNALTKDNVEFLAFFSPSGVNWCYDYFVKSNISLDGKKLIAIGPSTRKALENKGLEVFRTAEKPSVEYLIKVLINPDAIRQKQAEIIDE